MSSKKHFPAQLFFFLYLHCDDISNNPMDKHCRVWRNAPGRHYFFEGKKKIVWNKSSCVLMVTEGTPLQIQISRPPKTKEQKTELFYFWNIGRGWIEKKLLQVVEEEGQKKNNRQNRTVLIYGGIVLYDVLTRLSRGIRGCWLRGGKWCNSERRNVSLGGWRGLVGKGTWGPCGNTRGSIWNIARFLSSCLKCWIGRRYGVYFGWMSVSFIFEK